MDIKELINVAIKARNKAYAPYSESKVGAALLTNSGRIYSGCNIENSSYSPTICAERTAFAKAISEGERKFLAIAIVGGKNDYETACYPCGVCRQFMSEFCEGDFRLLLINDGEITEKTFDEIMPHRFSL